MKKHLSKILFLVIGLSLAATVSYLNAWTGPTQPATEGNVAAPINVGSTAQTKTGSLTSATILAANTLMSSNEICFGLDCKTSWASVGGGSSVPAGTVAAFNLATCPAGWIPADGTNDTRDLRGVFIRGMESFNGGTTISTRDPDRPNGTVGYTGSTANPTTYVNTLGSYQGNDFTAHGHANPSAGINGGNESRPVNVALLFCQKDGTSAGGGSSTNLVKYGGSYLVGAGGALNAYGMGACPTPNIVTGTCSCPSGYTARLTSQAAYYHFSAWDSTYSGYTCESL